MSETIKVKILAQEDREVWNDFVNNSQYGDILQFWQWGEVKALENWHPIRIGVIQEQKLILAAQMLLKKVGIFGNYGYIPHGPVFQNSTDLKIALPKLTEFLVKNSKLYNLLVVEIEPKIGQISEDNEQKDTGFLAHFTDPEILQIFQDNGFAITGRNMQPKYKLYYDLNKTEQELLSLCSKSTRYNIKQGEKLGVKVNEYLPDDTEIADKVGNFYQLLLETQARTGGYPIRSLSSFNKLFEIFQGSDNLSLFESSFEGDLIVSNISQRTKHWSSSFYAGSNRLHPKVKAPYLLRWRSIQKAKEYGSQIYDFWGIIPHSAQHKGYSDHKLSFGGARLDTYGLLALQISPLKYWFWSVAVKVGTDGKIWLRKVLWNIKNLFKKSETSKNPEQN